MNEFYSKVYPEAVKAEQKKNPVKKAGGVVVMFDKQKAEEERSKGPELTRVENFFGGTKYMRVLNLLEENHNIDLTASGMRGGGVRALMRVGVIGVSGPKLQIHRENLPELFKKTKAAKVRDLRNENPEITTKEISKRLGITPCRVNQLIKKLREAGLMEGKPKGKREAGKINNPGEEPRIKRKRLYVEKEDLMGMSKKAEKLDGKILELINKNPILYKKEIVEALKGTFLSSDIERSISRLAFRGFLKKSKERIDGKKEIKAEKIIPEEKK